MTDNRIYYSQPIQPVNRTNVPVVKPATTAQGAAQFSELFQRELGQVKFSQHALQRMQTRNISLDAAGMAKLTGAVDKAAQKGAKESLILMDNLALVVSIKNRTVITAMDGGNIKENVFTNIDSAVIV